MSRVKASIVAVLGLYLCACEDSRSRDAIAVEPNDLGITELDVRHDVVQGERVLTVRGFDRGGATIATAALRTGTVLYGADMPAELHAGTELKVAVNDIDTSFISPDRVAHVIYEPLSPSIGTFVRLHAVASEIDREAGIQFAPPKAPGDEIAFTAGACSGSRFPTNKGGSTQCCQDTTNTYHVNASNAVANRFTYAPDYPSIPVCRKSDGTTGCTGSACLYGPCGSAVGQVAGTNGHVFHPTSNPNVCGWDTGGPGGLGVDYSPEHYTNQTLYGSLTPTCTCNGCNADGTPQCPTIVRVNSTKVQAASSTSAATPALNVSSGNLLVVAISTFGSSTNTVSSVTDSAGNTFLFSGLVQYLNGTSGIQRLYYAYNSHAHASDVVTVTTSQSANYLDVVVAQYSGVLATSDPLDVTAFGQAANSTVTSSSFTPSNTNSLVVGLTTVNWTGSGTGPTSITAGSGYSQAQTVGALLIDAYEDRVDALASAQTASGSETGATSFQFGIIAAVFKPAGAGGGGSSIGRVNSTAVQSSSSATAATPALAVSSGNLIVVAISSFGSGTNTVSSITDSAGNTFRNSGLVQYLSGFSGIQRLYYAYNTNAHASDVVTVTMSQSATYLDVVVAQYSGVLATSDPLDVTAFAQGASASIASSSFTPSNANSLAVGFMTVNWSGSGPASFTAGSGYMVRQTIGGVLIDAYEDRIDAPASAQTASGSETGATTPFQIGIIAAVFKPAGGGGGSSIARVNSAMVQRSNSTSAATPALPVSSGNLIVVAISTYGSTSITVSSVTDSAGNTFLNSGVSQTLGSTGIQRLYYAYNSNANANDVVTVNVSQSAGYLDVVVAQYSGVRKTSNPLDVTASAQSTTSSVTSSSFTPSLANSLVVGLVTVNWTGSGPTSFTAGSGYSLNLTTGPTLIDALEDRLSAPASAQTASCSESGASSLQIGIIAVVFKPI